MRAASHHRWWLSGGSRGAPDEAWPLTQKNKRDCLLCLALPVHTAPSCSVPPLGHRSWKHAVLISDHLQPMVADGAKVDITRLTATEAVLDTAVSHDGARSATCSSDGAICTWHRSGEQWQETSRWQLASRPDKARQRILPTQPALAQLHSPDCPSSAAGLVPLHSPRWLWHSFTALTASLPQLAWCHPKHGRLLAVAKGTGRVSVWEEATEHGQPAAFYSKAALTDSRQPVHALAFGPCEQSLQLAAASADGHVRCAAAAASSYRAS